ncbi:MAG: Holliday junction resolvase RuvX [Deltaproteobacteria bacterium]|nr:Holliday junction resolvase RuvX [Deltaproteobacteria bacterium]
MVKEFVRILAIDFGNARIGLAVNDALGITAQGVGSINRTTIEKDIEVIKRTISSHHIKEIVVGMPYLLDGTKGKQAKRVEDFISELKKHIQLPIKEWDERYTTVRAEEILSEADVHWKKRKAIIDMLAATYILETYMEHLQSKK